MKKLLLLCILLFSSINIFAQDFYEIQAVYNEETKELAGSIIITPENISDNYDLLLYLNKLRYPESAGGAFSVDLQYENGFDPSYLIIDNVKNSKGDIAELEYYDPDFIKNETYESLLHGDTGVHIKFSQKSEYYMLKFKLHFPEINSMDFTSADDLFLSRFLWLPSPMADQSNMNVTPFKYEISINLPDGFALSGGEFNGISLWSFNSDSKAYSSVPLCIVNTRKYFETKIVSQGKTISVWTKIKDRSRGSKIAGMTAGILEYYEQLYGALDYSRISIIQGPGNSAASGAAAGMIVLANPLFNLDKPVPGILDPFFEFILAHEIAHLYFGIGVVPDFHEDNFLSESVTNFAALDYIEKKYGYFNNIINPSNDLVGFLLVDDIIDHKSQIRNSFNSFLNIVNTDLDYPLGAALNDQVKNSAAAVVYDKGLLAMRQIQTNIGSENQFYNLLKKYYQNFNHSIVDREFFLILLEKYSKNARDKFEEILTATVYPDFYYKEIIKEDRFTRITVGDKFNTGNDVLLFIKTSEGEFYNIISTDVSLEVSGKLLFSEIDPYWQTLDCNRKNNASPRKIKIIVGNQDENEADKVYLDYGLYMPSTNTDFVLTVPLFAGVGYRSNGSTDFDIAAGVNIDLNVSIDSAVPSDLFSFKGGYLSAELNPGKDRSIILAGLLNTDRSWLAGFSYSELFFYKVAAPPVNQYIPFLFLSSGLYINSDNELHFDSLFSFAFINSSIPALIDVKTKNKLVIDEPYFDGYAAALFHLYFKLAPRLYLVPGFGFGINYGDYELYDIPGNLSVTENTGDYQIFGKLNFMFPIIRDMDLSILNYAVLNGFAGNIYIEAEILQQKWDLSVTDIEAHFGIELAVNFTLLNPVLFPAASIALGFDIPVDTISDSSTYSFFLSFNQAFAVYAGLTGR